jgi:hypothetical protein
LRAFLGATGYCRIWILGYVDLARSLYQILKEAQKDIQPFIEWDDKSENAFHRLKKSLMTAPTLSLPIQDKFQLYVYEKEGLVFGMVTQFWGIISQPVGYLSKELDQVAKRWPGCLRVMATVSLLVLEVQKLILNRLLMVYTPHNLGGILNLKGELWLPNSHLLKYQAQLLGGTEITLRTYKSLNPASLLPEAEGNPEHSCEEVLMENFAAWPDLTDQPLKNSDLELYTDGSSSVKNGVSHAGFAVVTEFGTLKSGPLPPNTSA